MEYTMPRNEAQKFLEEQANRLHKGEISYEDYKAIEIKYTPLDLTTYNLPTEIERWINALFTEETTDRNGNYMLCGFTHHEIAEMRVLHLHSGDYSRSLSGWAYNDEYKLIYTYCEGDTTLKIFDNEEDYLKEKSETLRWYHDEF